MVGTSGMLLLLASLASAQDAVDPPASFNAHGFNLAPNDGDLRDLVSSWRPERQVKGSFGVMGLFEYASSPLVFMSVDEQEEVWIPRPLLDNLFGINLGAAWGGHERVAVTASVPLWFTSEGLDGVQGFAAGDVRIAIPIGLKLRETKPLDPNFFETMERIAPPEEPGIAISVIPFLSAPSGTSSRFLGSGTVTGGAVVAAGYANDTFEVTGNLGIDVLPSLVESYNLNGGPRILTGVTAAYEATDTLGLVLEGKLHKSLKDGKGQENAIPWAESPGEVLASARWRSPKGLSALFGTGVGFTRGSGAGKFRLFAGVGYTRGKNLVRDIYPDGIPDEPILIPRGEEAWLIVEVQDRISETAIEGASVKFGDHDGELRDGNTADDGRVRFDELYSETTVTINITHPFYTPSRVEDLELKPGENYQLVKLDAKTGGLLVTVFDKESREPLDAKVKFEAEDFTRKPALMGEDGSEKFDLPPTEWTLLFTMPNYLPETRVVTLDPGETEELIVAMEPSRVFVEDCQDEFVLNGRVEFDTDKATIRSDSFSLLKEVARHILACPQVVVEVQGHTDWRNTEAYNLDLSNRRSGAVVDFLVDEGVQRDRLKPKGYGESQPIAPNTTEEGMQKNRRVQFVIIDYGYDPSGSNEETPE